MLDTIVTPIPGDEPMGENVNYDADFDAVKTEMGKLGESDYEMIEQKCRAILSEKSKDIRVCAFLSFVLLRNEMFAEFADVYDGLAHLIESDFDQLHPQRPRGKNLAFKWLAEDKFKDILEQKKPGEKHHEAINRLVDSLSKLKKRLEEKFPENSPFPAGLYSKALVWQKATKPKPKPQASAPAGGGDAGAPGQPAELQSPKDAQTQARKSALFLIEKEPHKIMGYRLLRALRWDMVEKAPPVTDGKTALAGPNQQQRTYFQNLVGQKEWKTILQKGQETFTAAGNHLWLDLQRYLASACKELGAEYAGVHAAILLETAFFVTRVGAIQELCFNDGSPFCDQATKDWLKDDVMPALSGGGEGGDSGSGENKDPFEEERKQVDALAAANKIGEAVAFLQASVRTGGDEVHNFKRTLHIARLMLKVKQPDLAVSILESLDEKVEKYNLGSWNPDLAAEAWALLIQGIKVGRSNKPQNQQMAMTEQLNRTLKKLSQVHPVKALEINK
ncbi:MAG: type VI secretion system protein TssA [Chitinivibrionales bacterium]|nr:type VI secretion system protein TssA [Chitinivibrionales bacterium]